MNSKNVTKGCFPVVHNTGFEVKTLRPTEYSIETKELIVKEAARTRRIRKRIEDSIVALEKSNMLLGNSIRH